MASTQRWRNLLSQWMSACLAGVITGASLQLEQLTQALTYKDRSTYMEGCHTALTLQRGSWLVWPIFSLSEGPRAAGDDGARGAQEPHSPWCCSHQHSPCLGALGAHLRLEPKPAAMQAPKQAQLWPSNTAWRNHGRQEKGWQTHGSKLWPHPATHWLPDLCSSCTAPLSRASARAAAPLPAEHQLLPLPGLSGIPSLPRGDCY